MNRIILVGNGFDKAHGMATTYQEFMDDYWKSVGNEIFDGSSFKSYQDEFIYFKIPGLVQKAIRLFYSASPLSYENSITYSFSIVSYPINIEYFDYFRFYKFLNDILLYF